mmetsp:Transcript_9096/g.17143  ORF Transcript_9096/g.17143 Transcript_9096/m.17143 type:complete len:326 (+) Transcript_9096:232-1209(+)
MTAQDKPPQECHLQQHQLAMSSMIISNDTTTTCSVISQGSKINETTGKVIKTDYDCSLCLSSFPFSSISPTSTAISNIHSSTSTMDSSSGKETRNSRIKRLGKRKYDILYRVSILRHDYDEQENNLEQEEQQTSPTRRETRTNDPSPPHQEQKPNNEPASKDNKVSPFDTFVPGPISHFWQCRNCCNLPIAARAKHSVVFYAPPGAEETDTESRKKSAASSTALCFLEKRPTVQYHIRLCAAAIKRAETTLGITLQKQKKQQDSNSDIDMLLLKDTKDPGCNTKTMPSFSRHESSNSYIQQQQQQQLQPTILDTTQLQDQVRIAL